MSQNAEPGGAGIIHLLPIARLRTCSFLKIMYSMFLMLLNALQL